MTIDSIARNQLSDAMVKLNTMQRVNSAADDAAGMAIMEKLESQIQGLDQGTENTLDMQNLVKTAEGSLATIDDSLQRVRELSVQAANGIYSDEDRALIQEEVDQLIQGVTDIAKGTEFNNINLLDGSFTNRHTASSADGSGATVSIPGMDALSLGLQGYDVTGGKPNLDALENAMSQVSGVRSRLGATMNRFDYTANANNIMMLNQMAAKSRIADLDVAKGVNDLEKGRVLNEMQLYSAKREQEKAALPLSLLA